MQWLHEKLGMPAVAVRPRTVREGADIDEHEFLVAPPVAGVLLKVYETRTPVGYVQAHTTVLRADIEGTRSLWVGLKLP